MSGWLQMVDFREALNVRQARSSRREVADDDLALIDAMPMGGPETDLIKQRYGDEIKRAFRKVIEALPDDERALLRDHILRGLSIDDIGIQRPSTEPQPRGGFNDCVSASPMVFVMKL